MRCGYAKMFAQQLALEIDDGKFESSTADVDGQDSFGVFHAQPPKAIIILICRRRRGPEAKRFRLVDAIYRRATIRRLRAPHERPAPFLVPLQRRL